MELTARQKAEVDAAPVSVRGILTKAYGGQSKSACVRATCLRCVGYIRAEITNCTADACPLHPVRPYQTGSDDETAEEIAGFGRQDAPGA